jgi:hypothetical protein
LVTDCRGALGQIDAVLRRFAGRSRDQMVPQLVTAPAPLIDVAREMYDALPVEVRDGSPEVLEVFVRVAYELI